jgi:hypothetical protein
VIYNSQVRCGMPSDLDRVKCPRTIPAFWLSIQMCFTRNSQSPFPTPINSAFWIEVGPVDHALAPEAHRQKPGKRPPLSGTWCASSLLARHDGLSWRWRMPPLFPHNHSRPTGIVPPVHQVAFPLIYECGIIRAASKPHILLSAGFVGSLSRPGTPAQMCDL